LDRCCGLSGYQKKPKIQKKPHHNNTPTKKKTTGSGTISTTKQRVLLERGKVKVWGSNESRGSRATKIENKVDKRGAKDESEKLFSSGGVGANEKLAAREAAN